MIVCAHNRFFERELKYVCHEDYDVYVIKCGSFSLRSLYPLAALMWQHRDNAASQGSILK